MTNIPLLDSTSILVPFIILDNSPLAKIKALLGSPQFTCRTNSRQDTENETVVHPSHVLDPGNVSYKFFLPYTAFNQIQ